MKISKKAEDRVDFRYQRWAEWILDPKIPQLGLPTQVSFHPAAANTHQEKAVEDIKKVLRGSKDAVWAKASSSRAKRSGYGCMYMPHHQDKEIDLIYSELPERYQWAINGKYLTPKKDCQIAEALEMEPSNFRRMILNIYKITAIKLKIPVDR